MSMNASFRTISPRALEILRARPHLTGAILDFGSPDAPGAPGVPLPAELQEVLKGMPTEMAEQFKQNIGASLSGTFGGEGVRDREAEAEIAAHGITPGDLGEPLSILKAWHGLHFLLAGTTYEPSAGAGSAVLGGEDLGEDLGYGPVRALGEEEVAAIAAALELVAPEVLLGRYDAEAMEAAQIYPGGWSESENGDWLVEAHEAVCEYYLRARDARMAVLLYLT